MKINRINISSDDECENYKSDYEVTVSFSADWNEMQFILQHLKMFEIYDDLEESADDIIEKFKQQVRGDCGQKNKSCEEDDGQENGCACCRGH